MRWGGFTSFSLSDYPGVIAAVAFSKGCNFRCPYCHNPQLLTGNDADTDGQLEEAILRLLKRHQSFLDGLVVTGGEPSIQPDLPEFLSRVRAIGTRVKLDTNGSRPDVLADLINSDLLNYVAMDIKAPLHKYSKLAGVRVNVEDVKRSVEILINSELKCEFRTTVDSNLLDAEDLLAIGDIVGGRASLYLQPCNPGSGDKPGEEAIRMLHKTAGLIEKKYGRCFCR